MNAVAPTANIYQNQEFGVEGAVWGADVPNSPVILNPQFKGAPEPIDVFMVPTGRWSDGTAAPVM